MVTERIGSADVALLGVEGNNAGSNMDCTLSPLSFSVLTFGEALVRRTALMKAVVRSLPVHEWGNLPGP